MKKYIYLLFLILVVTSCKQDSDLRLTLPPHIYCSQFSTISMYYENIIQTSKPTDYTFKITPELGISDSMKYTFNIQEKASRNFNMSVDVFNKSGRKVASISTEVCYSTHGFIPSDTINVLITGNSLTANGIFPAKVKSIFLDSLHFPMRFLGTKQSNGGMHEGYGGKTWEWFSQNIESPFVFNSSENDTSLNFKHYFENVVKGRPGFVVVELGINDCFGADTTSVKTIDSTIDEMLKHTHSYLTKLIEYKPDLQIGVCLLPNPNSSESGFIASYGREYTLSGWTKIRHRVNKKYIDFFKENFTSNCSLIALDINIDTHNAYPDNNGLHPKPLGYHQFGSSVFNWLLYKINQEKWNQKT